MEMMQERRKELGAFYTPPEIVNFLVKWAIRSEKDLVIDPGAGEGAFIKGAIERLINLGKNPKSAIDQVYGIEYVGFSYTKILDHIRSSYNVEPKNVINDNFFDIMPTEKSVINHKSAPIADAIVGNPPYIERQRLKNINHIRKVLAKEYRELSLHTVTDIYGYFLIHATSFLKPGGRLAFIISDTWMNMNFGIALKEFLLKYYKIKAIIGFDKRVFSDALVRAVLLLAEKVETNKEADDNEVLFVRLKEASAVEKLHDLVNKGINGNGRLRVMKVKQRELAPTAPWGTYLKASNIYFNIIENPLIVKLRDIAHVGIGVQTLKKDFYIREEGKALALGIEKEFLDKIALSPRDTPMLIEAKKGIPYVVLYCDKPKSELKGTKILQYILDAESKKIRTTISKKEIIGYHNIPRIQQARRYPWYNLKPEIDKRCRSSIMFPRRIYERFFVVWNKARVVVNEDFINVEPNDKEYLLPLLAVLNSSFTEYLCRIRAQTYGGGVYDLRPEDVKNLPTLNLNILSRADLSELQKAYLKFVESGGTNREHIDKTVQKILGIKVRDWNKIEQEGEGLRALSAISKG